MARWYAWRADADNFATASGITAKESIFLTPYVSPAKFRRPVKLRICDGPLGELPLGDIVHTSGAQPLVLSTRAWDVLGSLLRNHGWFKTATFDNGSPPYYVWFPTVVADCVDEDRSLIRETLTDYRQLLKPVFRKADVPVGVPFVAKGFEKHNVWVDASFKRLIAKEHLTGADFSGIARSD